MAPNLCRAVLESDQGDLQIVHTVTGNTQVTRQLGQPFPESRSWGPNACSAIRDQNLEKSAGVFGRRWPAADCRMRDHTPEFSDTRPGNSPTSRIGHRTL